MCHPSEVVILDEREPIANLSMKIEENKEIGGTLKFGELKKYFHGIGYPLSIRL